MIGLMTRIIFQIKEKKSTEKESEELIRTMNK